MKKLVPGTMIVFFILLIIVSLMIGCPHYNVWRQEMGGKSELAKAEHTRKILVHQAKAELESAKIRSEAIAIVGEAAKKYPEYRTQEFIGAFSEAMVNGRINKIIFVPTEANIPIVQPISP